VTGERPFLREILSCPGSQHARRTAKFEIVTMQFMHENPSRAFLSSIFQILLHSLRRVLHCFSGFILFFCLAPSIQLYRYIQYYTVLDQIHSTMASTEDNDMGEEVTAMDEPAARSNVKRLHSSHDSGMESEYIRV
jgi:hypothetical protein